MKKLFNAIRNKAQSLAVRTQTFIQDVKGDLATNTIGAIIVAVVIIGLLVVAINAFFPTGPSSNSFLTLISVITMRPPVFGSFSHSLCKV